MNKKNCISFFLLLLVAIPLFFSLYTIIEKKLIEHRMKEKLEKEDLQTITLNASSVIWLKKNKELLINNQPFDVKKITRQGNNMTITGLYDLQEKKLKEKIYAYHHKKEKSATTNNSLLLLFFTTWHKANEPIHLTSPFSFYKKQPWQKRQDNICSLYHEIITPPPRLVIYYL